jgi:GTP-binding protein
MKKLGFPLFEISAATGKGVNDLMKAAFSELQKLPPIQIYEPEMDIEEGFLIDTTEQGFEISKDEEVYVVSGTWIEAVGGSVNFSDEESLQYFQRALKNRGVIDALVEAGIQEGDTVRIGDLEFDFVW